MKKLIFVMSFFLILYTPYIVHGEDIYNIIDETEHITAGDDFNVADTARDITEGKFNFTFSGVCDYLINLFFGEIKKSVPDILKMVVVALISGVATTICGTKNEVGVFCCLCVVSVICLKTFSFSMECANTTCDTLYIFMQSLMPSVASASLATGQTAQSTACGVAFCAMQIFIYICRMVILPFITVLVALSVVDSLGEVSYLKGIIRISNQVLKWGTGLMLTIYTAIIAIQFQMAGSLDTLGGKAIKYAVGSFVPIVGGALAESLEVVASGAKLIKNALGISGIIGVCYICIGPLINLCAIALSYKVASAVAVISSDGKVAKVIGEIGGGITKVCINLTAISVMFIISLAVLCRMGGAV